MITHLSKDIQRIMITQIPIGPKNGTINTVIHISDIHIRNGNKNQNRFDEYHGVFRNLFDKIQNRNNEYSVCVITGDIFHNKSKIESSGIMLFNDFLNKLSKLIPVYIIQGNHDYRQDEPNEPGDHLATAVGNVLGDSPGYDLAVHYDGLSVEAVRALEEVWRLRMEPVLQELNAKALEYQEKENGPARFRGGGYFHVEIEE